jgi:ribosomal protein S18 acetylase RimI-like enzyme
MSDFRIRSLEKDDYPVIISRVDDWWGRPVAGMLPRLFLRHFHATSLAAVDHSNDVVGFLVGFVSPAIAGEAHTHFIAVAPGMRASGLGNELYQSFFELARQAGCRTVTAVVSPVNTGSQRFHLAVGFKPKPKHEPSDDIGQIPVWVGWDGPGNDRIRFEYAL